LSASSSSSSSSKRKQKSSAPSHGQKHPYGNVLKIKKAELYPNNEIFMQHSMDIAHRTDKSVIRPLGVFGEACAFVSLFQCLLRTENAEHIWTVIDDNRPLEELKMFSYVRHLVTRYRCAYHKEKLVLTEINLEVDGESYGYNNFLTHLKKLNNSIDTEGGQNNIIDLMGAFIEITANLKSNTKLSYIHQSTELNQNHLTLIPDRNTSLKELITSNSRQDVYIGENPPILIVNVERDGSNTFNISLDTVIEGLIAEIDTQKKYHLNAFICHEPGHYFCVVLSPDKKWVKLDGLKRKKTVNEIGEYSDKWVVAFYSLIGNARTSGDPTESRTMDYDFTSTTSLEKFLYRLCYQAKKYMNNTSSELKDYIDKVHVPYGEKHFNSDVNNYNSILIAYMQQLKNSQTSDTQSFVNLIKCIKPSSAGKEIRYPGLKELNDYIDRTGTNSNDKITLDTQTIKSSVNILRKWCSDCHQMLQYIYTNRTNGFDDEFYKATVLCLDFIMDELCILIRICHDDFHIKKVSSSTFKIFGHMEQLQLKLDEFKKEQETEKEKLRFNINLVKAMCSPKLIISPDYDEHAGILSKHFIESDWKQNAVDIICDQIRRKLSLNPSDEMLRLVYNGQKQLITSDFIDIIIRFVVVMESALATENIFTKREVIDGYHAILGVFKNRLLYPQMKEEKEEKERKPKKKSKDDDDDEEMIAAPYEDVSQAIEYFKAWSASIREILKMDIGTSRDLISKGLAFKAVHPFLRALQMLDNLPVMKGVHPMNCLADNTFYHYLARLCSLVYMESENTTDQKKLKPIRDQIMSVHAKIKNELKRKEIPIRKYHFRVNSKELDNNELNADQIKWYEFYYVTPQLQ
jgi:hypothetical protein